MNVISQLSEWPLRGRRAALAIGMFDGVHLGHQAVLLDTVEQARKHDAVAAAVTFDLHPNVVVAPSRIPPRIYSLNQRLRAFAQLGMEAVWVIHFDEDFSRQTGREFVALLQAKAGPLASITVGQEFTFGRQRGGNVALLREMGRELGFEARGLPPVSEGGQVVSSTCIREAIRDGKLPEASRLLGRPYAVAGGVKRGDGRAREWGFPTANVDVSGAALPPTGVYLARAHFGTSEYPAVLNLGRRPTVSEAELGLRLEAHLLGFSGDLYGQEVELAFGAKLREEIRFANVEALRLQIAADVQTARQYFHVDP